MFKKLVILPVLLVAVFGFSNEAYAHHAWGGYHWRHADGEKAKIQIGENLSLAWERHLATSTRNWNKSSVIALETISGAGRPRLCSGVYGRVEVCNYKYGVTGWLGLTQIVVEDHIVQATIKMNDTYLMSTTTGDFYKKPAWRNETMCHEIGHALGLDHQDEDFNNANLGSCLDFTTKPWTNQKPNAHDYEELELIYGHTDVPVDSLSVRSADAANPVDTNAFEHSREWGRLVAEEAATKSHGRESRYMRDLGQGKKLITIVSWVD